MRHRIRFFCLAIGATFFLPACGSPGVEPEAEPIPSITADAFDALLRSSDRPVLVNIWAAWCVPCRSEAPLLRQAHERFADRIEFVGIDIEDTQADALAFLAEFNITYDNYFDPRGDIPAHLGGFGVPLTYFFAPGGELVYFHAGVIDERTLALQIDELLARS